MKAQDLKNSILQMAVQGKLVPQDPADEPASALLERIREERAKLIKDKKIKAPKGGESVIYRGSDGSHYEKRGKGEPVCIDGEIPFDVPESWEWARLGSVCAHIVDGDHNPPKDSGSGVPIFSAANVHDGRLHFSEARRWITKEQYKKHAKRLMARPGCVLLTIVGTIGRTAVLDHSEDFALQRSVAVLSPIELEAWYVARLLESYAQYLNSISSGTAQKGVYLGTVSELLIPIPPLAEQQRIVERIDELMPLVEEYGRLEDAREALDAALPERLRKSVLQMAVQGKLVEQDPADEPASVLLERIREERADLIKQKKIKAPKGGESVIYRDGGFWYERRGKSEPVCIDDEIPFEIPESWEWVKFADICIKLTDGSHNPPPKRDNGYPVISAMSIKRRRIDLAYVSRYADEAGFIKENPRTRISRGDVILGIIGGSIGNVAIYDHDDEVIAQRSIAIISTHGFNEYVSHVLESPLCESYYKTASGTAQGGIYLSTLGEMLIPLPPVFEQRRIVSSIAKMLALIEEFEKE